MCHHDVRHNEAHETMETVVIATCRRLSLEPVLTLSLSPMRCASEVVQLLSVEFKHSCEQVTSPSGRGRAVRLG